MKRHGLLLVSLVSVGLAGLLMMRQAAGSAQHSPGLPGPQVFPAAGRAPFMEDEAARRWLQGESRHWRDYVLHQ
jgi:hypothetical protein